MKIEEILKAKTIKQLSTDFLIGTEAHHLDFVHERLINLVDLDRLSDLGVTIEEKYHKTIDDYSNYVSISVVKLDGIPFMVICNSGFNYSYVNNYIIDKDTHNTFKSLVFSCIDYRDLYENQVDITSELFDSVHETKVSSNELGKEIFYNEN